MTRPDPDALRLRWVEQQYQDDPDDDPDASEADYGDWLYHYLNDR